MLQASLDHSLRLYFLQLVRVGWRLYCIHLIKLSSSADLSLDTVSCRESTRRHRRTFTLPSLCLHEPSSSMTLSHAADSIISIGGHLQCLHFIHIQRLTQRTTYWPHDIVSSIISRLIALSCIIISLASLCILTTPLPQLPRLLFHPRIHLMASADGNATPSCCKHWITSPSTPWTPFPSADPLVGIGGRLQPSVHEYPPSVSTHHMLASCYRE